MHKSILAFSVSLFMGISPAWSGSNQKDNAGAAKAIEYVGLGLNAGSAAFMFNSCYSPCGSPSGCHWPSCAFGMMNLSQMAANMVASQGASATEAAVDTGLGDWELPNWEVPNPNLNPNPNNPHPNPNPNGNGPSRVGADLQNQYNQMREDAARHGLRMNDDGTVSTPGGTLDPSAMTTVAGMMANGFSEQQAKSAIAALKKLNAKAEKEYNAVAMGLQNTPKGKGFQTGKGLTDTTEYKSGFDLNALLKKKKNKNRQPAGFKGMKKVVSGGDPIGVAADNIFRMVTRRYQAKDQQDYFIKK